jgi:hypothetical protein
MSAPNVTPNITICCSLGNRTAGRIHAPMCSKYSKPTIAPDVFQSAEQSKPQVPAAVILDMENMTAELLDRETAKARGLITDGVEDLSEIGAVTPAQFKGPAYDQQVDGPRLTSATMRVWNFCTKGARFHTLSEISRATLVPEASVSAMLRAFTRDEFGAHTKTRRRRGDPRRGAWEYQIAQNPSTFTPQDRKQPGRPCNSKGGVQ